MTREVNWVESAIEREEKIRVTSSRDQYSYSPILKEILDDKIADGVLFPKTEDELVDMISYLYRHNIMTTIRGAGTGNYGQAVPLHGGVVIDIKGLNEILEITDGFVRVQAGAKMGMIEKAVREQGQELRIFPTTYVKSTASGFVCGGAGGVGSITWGDLWDGDNVHAVVVYTMEENPRRLEITGPDIHRYVHGYGTTGVIMEIVFPLERKNEWNQYIAQFASFEQAMKFSEKLAHTDTLPKRLICTMEEEINGYLIALSKHLVVDKATVLLEVAETSVAEFMELVDQYGGEIRLTIDAANYHKGLSLSDYSFNHTTLWVMNKDKSYTYQQAGFSSEDWATQVKQVKEKYGHDVLLHFEWIRGKGNVVTACLPIVKYYGAEHMEQLADDFKAWGIHIFNPHTYLLDDGGRPQFIAKILEAKHANDPKLLLNPGKLITS